MSYLIVTSIQMGANIDYAIVISTWYSERKTELPPEQAIVKALDLAFPTVLTSGSILSAAGFLIGQITTEPSIVGIGQCLSRGHSDLYVPGDVRPAPDPAAGRQAGGEDHLPSEEPGPQRAQTSGRRGLHQRAGPGPDLRAWWTPRSTASSMEMCPLKWSPAATKSCSRRRPSNETKS